MRPPTGADAVPLLETTRLRLRGHRAEDLSAYAAICSGPCVIRYLGRAASPTRNDAWLRLLRYPGLWAWLGYDYWAIEEKASGRFIGDIGYADFKRALEPSLDGCIEMGWVLAADKHGQGYASEALAAVLDWGDAQLGRHVAVCLIEPANVGSTRLAAKAGFDFWPDVVADDGATPQLFRRQTS